MPVPDRIPLKEGLRQVWKIFCVCKSYFPERGIPVNEGLRRIFAHPLNRFLFAPSGYSNKRRIKTYPAPRLKNRSRCTPSGYSTKRRIKTYFHRDSIYCFCDPRAGIPLEEGLRLMLISAIIRFVPAPRAGIPLEEGLRHHW